ncbi:hypothetical protein MKX03_016626 [Papaver bracteatum]|nr:hypothetical protein MKX03_016626 [Papaver bracteatum]
MQFVYISRSHNFNRAFLQFNHSFFFFTGEKKEREKETKKLQAKEGKMKMDGSAKKKKGSSGFQVGKKKVETKKTALNEAKALWTLS